MKLNRPKFFEGFSWSNKEKPNRNVTPRWCWQCRYTDNQRLLGSNFDCLSCSAARADRLWNLYIHLFAGFDHSYPSAIWHTKIGCQRNC